ncbi:MAG: hypothetical protein J1F31_02855 [Erysipelotrichales bacterium]|nr:hypothetical protein [Erysipelotrichales bacterium]
MINKNYDDIINLPHHTSKTHKQMSIYDRAAQFSPFAALTGYESVIQETSRTTTQKILLSENQVAVINEKLLILNECLEQPLITIIYFKKDKKKTGGKYQTIQGKIKKIDETNKVLILQDGTKILLDDLYDIKADIFVSYDLE